MSARLGKHILNPSRKRLLTVALLAGVVAGVSGCNNPIYAPTSLLQAQQAPGSFLIAPKIDLILVEDDTGSIDEALPTLQQQIPQFLNQLDAEGWDYHFATFPLTTYRAVTQVMASKQDSNWGSLWQPPYPGALPNGPGTVSPSVFTFPNNYTDWVLPTSNQLSGVEPGFQTIQNILTTGVSGTNLIRPDAMLAFVVVGNGNDTSGVNMCRRWDGVTIPCGDNSAATSFASYLSYFQSLKSDPSQVKFFSLVANEKVAAPPTGPGCLGGTSYVGTRYQNMAANLGGYGTLGLSTGGAAAYDVCSQPISTALNTLSGMLQATRMDFETQYLFADRQPDPTTITVTKYVGGLAGNAISIPQAIYTPDPNYPLDPTKGTWSDGWSYDGYLTNVYAIDAPVPMNLSSGYAIELHGTAKLHGSDTADLNFMPAGVQVGK